LAKSTSQYNKQDPASADDGTNKTPFIDAKTAFEAYDESNKWLRPYFDPIVEFERIARNRPSDKISPELPRITDGTMAAIVQEQPKRVIQQTPTGLVACKDYPEYAKIADIVLAQELVPKYNRMGSMIQKSWNMVGKAMTWGRSTSYTFWTSTNGTMHTDFVIPYAKDVISEKGKVYAPDSNVAFLRSWYQNRDIKAIINREKALQQQNPKYQSDWDLVALAKFLDGGSTAKPTDLQTPAERERGDGYSGGFEVIHAFQKGKNAEFYSFSPKYEQGATLRKKTTKDPRGQLPLDFLYCNIDLSNPMGRGQVELSGGVQNLIDQQMQMFQFLTTMMMGPPLQTWGSVNKASLKYRPNVIWDMGSNPQANLVKPVDIDNASIANFPNNYGLLKSQILNLNSSQDSSVSAESGNPSFSKTQAGVKAQEQRLGVSDNYLRKQFEEWFGNQSETSINIFFSEMTGKKTLKLEGNDLKEIQKTPAQKFVDDKGVLTIPYKEIDGVVFHFQVDPSSSEVKEDNDNAEKLTEVLKIMEGSQDPSILQKIPQIMKLIIDEIGAEGTDDLFPELSQDNPDGTPNTAGAPPAQPPVDPQAIVQLVQQTVEQIMQQQKDSGTQAQNELKAKELDLKERQFQTDTVFKADKQAHDNALALHNATKPEPAPNQGAKPQTSAPKASPKDQTAAVSTDHPLTPPEEEIVQALFKRGFDENDAEQAITMLRAGQNPDQIIQTLGAKYATQ
jgi:hypothetical protein